ncbi:MAG TPA: membrane dipeptidase [Massilibacterium sp.]|nr:membrane dipeptidase [Massilibacterium sp.]
MRLVDLHCDALLKMWRDGSIDFYNDQKLQVSYKQLKNNNMYLQVMAIYVPQNIPMSERFLVSLQMIDLFIEKIVKRFSEVVWVKTKDDFKKITKEKTGLLLSLEGVEPILDSITYLKTLYRLGIKSIGITWNKANLAADGVMEQRGGGLTAFGREIVRTNEKYRIITDVSHLSHKGIYDCLSLTSRLIASHSNVYDVCQHPRNLQKEAIEWLIEKNGLIGLTFVPTFVSSKKASLYSLLDHLDYLLGLGGEKVVSFGSDFDGMDESMPQLKKIDDYDRLLQFLSKYYSDTVLYNICEKNAVRFFQEKL